MNIKEGHLRFMLEQFMIISANSYFYTRLEPHCHLSVAITRVTYSTLAAACLKLCASSHQLCASPRRVGINCLVALEGEAWRNELVISIGSTPEQKWPSAARA